MSGRVAILNSRLGSLGARSAPARRTAPSECGLRKLHQLVRRSPRAISDQPQPPTLPTEGRSRGTSRFVNASASQHPAILRTARPDVASGGEHEDPPFGKFAKPVVEVGHDSMLRTFVRHGSSIRSATIPTLTSALPTSCARPWGVGHLALTTQTRASAQRKQPPQRQVPYTSAATASTGPRGRYSACRTV